MHKKLENIAQNNNFAEIMKVTADLLEKRKAEMNNAR